MKLPLPPPLPRRLSYVAAGLLLALGFGPSRLDADADDAPPAPQPVRVTEVEGQKGVKLTPEEMKRAAIESKVLPPATRLPSQRAYGVVLDLAPFLDAAAQLTAGQAQAESTAAALTAARAEQERARRLHDAGENVSTRDLQVAEAAWQQAAATARAARAMNQARRATIEQTWGPVLAGWMVRSSPEFTCLAKGEERLVRIVLPGAPPVTPLEGVSVERPDGHWVPATPVSPAARVDPQFQGAAYYYLVPADAGMAPGLNVTVSVPTRAAGGARPGVIVPASAVLWWQGQTWVYLEPKSGLFARHAIATDQPDEQGGYFVSSLPAAVPVVIAGADVLLSEETRPAVAPNAD